ncbi:thaumatin-like protein 1b [Lolium rigidum]|uniref:thaumatin-like protein 1b n=1 Tax=Lolium rigidum TaxID=89674 RepID=UPI001F5DE8F6|nr:thaumatin-like protein 1b [Lolium rigidum]
MRGGALLSLLCLSFLQVARPATFTVTNGCSYTVWPGILSNAGVPPPATTGFALSPGKSSAVAVADGWSGRIWGRTLCGPSVAGAFACVTGDCGSGTVECSGRGASPPATLAEFTLAGAAGENDFYDVSLVDGYNVPVLVAPAAAAAANGSSCQPTGCPADLNASCPPELHVVAGAGAMATVACRSACEAFGTAEYCCSGAHGTPATCPPTAYSRFFKAACPLAYSYAYDDATSTFTCAGARDGGGYDVVFCPGGSSLNPGANPGAAVPPSTSTAYPPMVFSSADADPAVTRCAIILLLVAMTICHAMSTQ